MGLIYIGNCEFEEISDFEVGRDLFGMDTMTRTYEGRTDKLNAFMAKVNASFRDDEYRNFRARSASSNRGSGPFTRVRVEFVGLWKDELPEERPIPGWRRQTSSFTVQGGQETCEVDYAAPTTIYRYVTREKPTAQRFKGKLELLDAAWEIYQIRGAKTIDFFEVQPVGRIGGVVSGGRAVTGKFNYVKDIVTAAFNPRPAGDYWEVEEENEGRMLSVDREDLPRFLFPNRIAGNT